MPLGARDLLSQALRAATRRVAGTLLLGALALAPPAAHAQDPLFIEEMTWVEVADAIKAGKRTALIFAGSTEQNGPHMVLGKHNLVARHLAARIARELGDALVYPVLPYAPTGDKTVRSGHMRYPGSVSLRAEVYGELMHDLVLSAAAAGFRTILVMADHGEGQDRLAAVAKELDASLSPGGVRVHFVDAVYTQAVGEHAGREDTSMLLAVEGGRRGVRQGRIAQAGPDNGAVSSPAGASAAEGWRLLDVRVRAAVNQIRELTAASR